MALSRRRQHCDIAFVPSNTEVTVPSLIVKSKPVYRSLPVNMSSIGWLEERGCVACLQVGGTSADAPPGTPHYGQKDPVLGRAMGRLGHPTTAFALPREEQQAQSSIFVEVNFSDWVCRWGSGCTVVNLQQGERLCRFALGGS